MYLAVIGDLVESRSIEDRPEVQERLLGVIERLNRELPRAAVAASLDLTAGDEVQVLLTRPGESMTIMAQLSEELSPLRMTFGLGWGTISTPIYPRVARMDGPAFHRARAALDRAQELEVLGCTNGLGDAGDHVASALLGLMGAVRWSWTEKQASYARASRHHLQKDIARDFGVVPSVVSESLKAAHVKHVLRAEEAFVVLLERFAENTDLGSDSAIPPNLAPSDVSADVLPPID